MTYAEKKDAARQAAMEWQRRFESEVHYESEYAEWTAKFTKLGKRYGLLEEFKENGII